MKFAALFICLAMVLTGCSSGNRDLDRGMAIRSSLLEAIQCSFDAEITADYGDKLYTFRVSCRGNSQGDLSFEVTAPESISGITGTVSNYAGKLTFDDVALQFDLMAEDQITPVAAPWILLKTLRSGYLTSAGMEGDLLRLTIDDSYAEDALQVDVWFDSGDQPVRCGILHDGRQILSLTVENFQIR